MIILQEEIQEIIETARQAVEKIEASNVPKKPILEVMLENMKRFDMGRDSYEPYEESVFANKTKVDMMFYDKLLNKLDESDVKSVEPLIGQMYRSVNEIYEFINISPEIYGKNVSFDLLEASLEDSAQTIDAVIFEFLDKNFYNLSPQQRTDKYCDECKEFSKKLINEHQLPVEEAIEYCVKSKIMEGLLDRIAFPTVVKSRLNYLSESEDYGKVFDQSGLLDLLETYSDQLQKVARIIAATV